jgi:hypothetical protein
VAAIVVATIASETRAEEPVVRFTLHPMAAPRPALAYQLLPELSELNPGNPAQNYLKCFMEQRTFFYGPKAVADRARYLAAPLAELPLAELKEYGGNALRQADWAARLDAVDWQAIPRIQSGAIDIIPGELGPLQVLADALQVRFRAEVAARKFDDAVRSGKTMFALAHHLGRHPTIVANLIGLSVAHLGAGALEEMVQQPGCPNLYWALAVLPFPLVDLRAGIQGDRMRAAAELRRLRGDAAMDSEELEEFVSRLSGTLSFAREQAGRPPRKVRADLRARATDPEATGAARRRLIASGAAESQLAKLPPLQIILLADKADYEIEHDERAKLVSLSYPEAVGLASRMGLDPRRDGVFHNLLPDVLKLRRTQDKLGQQIALLRVLEAARLYAAEHGGNLPRSVSDFSVPLPADPISGKPFIYAVEGKSAHIRSEPASGDSKSGRDAVHYLVTLEK